MAVDSNIFVKLTTEYDGKALNKGKKDLTDFEKLTKSVGKTLGAAFAVKKIIAFGESSVQAFVESEKAGKALNQTLTNLGMAYKSPAIDSYLSKLSLQVGIVDEELKPAYNSLLLATRNTAEAQSILSTALDVSAGTGYDLNSVIKALSKAYLGNNTALQKLGIGLTKAQLAGSNFKQLQMELNSVFTGQAASAAQGYTGDIAKLTVAYDQFKESIGKGILTGLSANGNIDQATASITKLGSALGVTTGYLIKFATSWAQLFDKNVWTKFWDELTGKAVVQVDAGSDRGGASKADDQRRAALAKLQAKAATAQTSAAKATTAAAKAQALLGKAGTVLDVQQAQIYAALQGKITDQEKLRLDLQLALLTGNATAADKLSQELLASQLRTTDLATTISNLPKALNPFADWPKYIQDLIAQMAGLNAAIPKSISAPTTAPTTTTQNPYDVMFEKLKQQNIVAGIEPGAAAGLAASSSRLQAEADAYFKAHPEIDPMTGAIRSGFAGSTQNTYNISIDATSLVDPTNMTNVVQNALLLVNRNGLPTVPAGQGFGF
jgi:hypothetical protein